MLVGVLGKVIFFEFVTYKKFAMFYTYFIQGFAKIYSQILFFSHIYKIQQTLSFHETPPTPIYT